MSVGGIVFFNLVPSAASQSQQQKPGRVCTKKNPEA